MGNIKRFLRGELSDGEIPDIVKHRQWNWRNHVYLPGSACPDFVIQAQDPIPDLTNTSVPPEQRVGFGPRHNLMKAVHNVFGTHKIPEPAFGKGYGWGKTILLREALNYLGGNRIVFVFGCRGDNSIPVSRLIAEAKPAEPQTYPLERSALRNKLPEHERLVSYGISTNSKKRRQNNSANTEPRYGKNNRMNLG